MKENKAQFVDFVTVGGYSDDLTPEKSEEQLLHELYETMDYALDENGKMYEDKDEFMKVLKAAPSDKVFYICNEVEAKGVKNYNGIFKMTDKPITPESQLPEEWRNRPYDPKPSLKFSDITAKPTDFTYVKSELNDKIETAEKIEKYPNEYVNQAR